MQPANTRLLTLGFLVLLIAMVALAFHISAQRPDEAELIVSENPGASRTIPVTLYAYDSHRDMDAAGNVLCGAQGLVPVTREIPASDTPLAATLGALFMDPLTEEERASGLSTEFPLEGVRLENVTVDGKEAIIAIQDPQRKMSGGSCRVGILRAQIEATAMQFPDITHVRFTPLGVLEP